MAMDISLNKGNYKGYYLKFSKGHFAIEIYLKEVKDLERIIKLINRETTISRTKCQHERNLDFDIFCLLSDNWINKNICKNICTNYKARSN